MLEEIKIHMTRQGIVGLHINFRLFYRNISTALSLVCVLTHGCAAPIVKFKCREGEGAWKLESKIQHAAYLACCILAHNRQTIVLPLLSSLVFGKWGITEMEAGGDISSPERYEGSYGMACERSSLVSSLKPAPSYSLSPSLPLSLSHCPLICLSLLV